MEQPAHDIAPNTLPEVADAQAHALALRELQAGPVTTPDGKHHKPGYHPVALAWEKLKDAWGGFFSTIRHNAINATPGPIVNNSTNILGTAHVMTEMMMFKASMNTLVDKHNYWDYVPKALWNVYKDSIKRSGKSSTSLSELVHGNPLKNVYEYVTNTEAATARDVAAQIAEGVEKVSLNNRWQTRSTLAGLTVWGLSAVIPDKKESDQEVERMEIMRRTNKPKYVAERFKQALWFPGWPDHKRQMIGLGIMASGLCSTVSSWRNRDKLSAVPKYIFNGGYLFTSLITLASSLPLLFASDDQKGFGWFGTVMTSRLFFLPTSIYKKFKMKEDGAWYYLGATAGFQAENWTQALIGGAEKNPDGSIIDHSASHKAGREKAQEIKREIKETKAITRSDIAADAVPTTTIGTIASREAAMPERVAAHQHG